jgi:hypothetical protein
LKALLLILLFAAASFGQTLHLNASDTDHLCATAGAPCTTGSIADAAEVCEWVAETPADTSAASAACPNYRSSSPGMLAAVLDFNGTADQYELENDAGTNKVLSDFIANNAFTVIMAVRMDAVPSGTSATEPYLNNCILCDTGDYWGLFVRSNGGTPEFQLYNWDGNADIVTLTAAADTNYIVTLRHDSGTIYGSLNCGSETSATSGNTSDLTNQVRIATNSGVFYDGRIGAIKVLNTGDAGGASSECSTMKSTFVESSSSATPLKYYYR